MPSHLEQDESKMDGATNILMLPEDVMSKILSVTSPRDACRASAISKGFNSADSNTVWERFLPSDYSKIIARAVSPVNFSCKKQLYHSLSNSHILLDSGYLSFKLDKESGKKCYMLGARELSIAWQDDMRYWEWGCIPETRFPKVAILRKVCWLEIRGKIANVNLSRNSTYVAYLVFRLTWNSRGLSGLAKARVSVSGIRDKTSSDVCLYKPGRRGRICNISLQADKEFPRKRMDEWTEIKLGEIYCDEGDDGEVEMVFEEVTHGNWKSGLIIEGIELRPK